MPTVVNRKWSQIRNPEVLTVVIVRSCSSAPLPFMLVTNLIPGSVSLVLLPNLRKGDQMSLSPPTMNEEAEEEEGLIVSRLS